MLVADDDPTLRLLCRVNLEQEGYDVVEAESAQDVERVLESRDVGVLLLDVHLGADDGIAVAEHLRETAADIRIALFSGSVTELPASARALADDVIPKPFTLEGLSETVRRLAFP